MENLHWGAKWLFRIRSYGILIFLGLFLMVWSIGLLKAIFGGVGFAIMGGLFFCLVFVVLLGEVYSRMSYNRWKFEFNKSGLKLERGIIWKKYSNIPYERVQNVDVHRGIIARMFGFSTVDIETAGQSGFGGFQVRHGGYSRGRYRSEGHIPAVSKERAEEIREYIMKKVTRRSK